MMKDSVQSWLMAHPTVLWVLFLIAAKGSEHIPDGVSTQSGASGSFGP